MEEEYYKSVEVKFDDINFTILDGGQLAFLFDDIKDIIIKCNKTGFIGKDSHSSNVDDFVYTIKYSANEESILSLNVTCYFDH